MAAGQEKLPMINERCDDRFPFVTKCRLDINDCNYSCLIDNLSTAGASVEMTDEEYERIHVGDTGALTVLLLTSVTYLCTVVRMDADRIGLQFIDN
jgi:hypothetical protein